MKKLICLALCLMMMAGVAMADDAVTPGVYTAASKGMGGDVTVEVTIGENGSIDAVKVVSHSETPGLSDPAIEQIPAAIVVAQSPVVDAVAGATITSKAIMAAVTDCATQAGIEIAAAELPENTFEGVGKGIGGELKVWLEVVDGKMISLTVTEQSETEFVAKPALEKIPAAIIDAQSFDVDTVSGATVTSKAIINAAKDAARQAGLTVE